MPDGFQAVERKFGGDLGVKLSSRLRERKDWADLKADPKFAMEVAEAMVKWEREGREYMRRAKERHEQFHGTRRPECSCTWSGHPPIPDETGCQLHSMTYMREWGRERGYRD